MPWADFEVELSRPGFGDFIALLEARGLCDRAMHHQQSRVGLLDLDILVIASPAGQCSKDNPVEMLHGAMSTLQMSSNHLD